jgi:hypothetical protein
MPRSGFTRVGLLKSLDESSFISDPGQISAAEVRPELDRGQAFVVGFGHRDVCSWLVGGCERSFVALELAFLLTILLSHRSYVRHYLLLLFP